jgi:hypothetical protein
MKLLPIQIVVLALGLTSYAGENRRTDLVIEQSCLIAPVVLVDCDLRTDPPQCHKAKITYRKGCERISVQGGRP